jgi:3-hydroxyisobutyrate dehydrogenase-like beta-hydroxyacid dehydrogenase
MKIGYIGLGKMGKGMVLNLLEKGIEIVAWNNIEKNKSILYEQTYYYSNTVSNTKIVKDTLEVIEIINNFLINN